MRVGQTAVIGGGRKARYNCQGKMNFAQGKVREFYFRLRMGTLNKAWYFMRNIIPYFCLKLGKISQNL